MKRAGTADLQLHGGAIPTWLFSRMKALALPVVKSIILQNGKEDFLARMSILFSKDFLLASLAFPIKHLGAEIHMVMANPPDKKLVTTLACMAGSEVIPYCGAATDIRAAIDQLYMPTSSDEGSNSGGAKRPEQDIEACAKQIVSYLSEHGFINL